MILISLVVTLDTYSCMDPGIPVNGIRLSHDLSIGSMVSFQCDPGYRLSHEDPLVCEKNHFWSHPLPTCDGTYICYLCFTVHFLAQASVPSMKYMTAQFSFEWMLIMIFVVSVLYCFGFHAFDTVWCDMVLLNTWMTITYKDHL